MDRDENPAGQQQESAQRRDPDESVRRAQGQAVERSGKQDRSSNPADCRAAEAGRQAGGRRRGPPGEPEQPHGMNEVVKHRRLPERGGLPLRQDVVQGMGAESA